MSKVIGIDLGNKNCVVAVPNGSVIDIIENESCNRISPSMVTYTNDRRFGGELAHQNQMEHYKTTITNLKYLIGLKYDSDERRQIEAVCTYEIVELEDGYVGIKVQFKGSDLILRPEQCITFLLKDLIEMAKASHPEAEKCAISVSPWWSHFHRRSLLNAVKIGNIDCVSLVNSTTAAAVSYVKIHGDKLPPKEAKPVPVMFIDLGDYSMNVTIALVKQNYVQIKSYAYDDHLGGAWFTEDLIPYLLALTMQKYKLNPRENPRAWLRFLDAAEKLKKTLSINPSVPFEVPCLMNDIDVNFIVKREDFEARIKGLIDRIGEPINKALEYAELKKEDLYGIECLGGGARVVAVKEKITEVLGREPMQTLNIDECFAEGAAIVAENLTGEKNDLELIDAAPNEISAYYVDGETQKQEVLFKKFAPVPSETKLVVPVDGHLTIKIESTACPIGTIDLTLASGKADVEVTLGLSRSSYIHFKEAKVVSEGEKPELTVSFSFAGEILEHQLEDLKNLEEEMSKCDENEKEIDVMKNNLESSIFEAENGINRDFPDFFDPAELIKFKKDLQDIHEWFSNNEFDRFPLEEYQSRVEAIKSVLEPAKERCLKYNAFNDAVLPLKDKANELLVAVKTDADRIDGGEKEALQKDIADFIEEVDKALAEPKHQELKYTPEEFEKRFDSLQSRKDSLQKLPTKAEVEQQKQQQSPKPTHIQTPDEEEEAQMQIPPNEEQQQQQRQPKVEHPQEEGEEQHEEEENEYPTIDDLIRDFWGQRYYGGQQKQQKQAKQQKPKKQEAQQKKETKPVKVEEPVEDNYYYDKYGHIIGIKPKAEQIEQQPQKQQQKPVQPQQPKRVPSGPIVREPQAEDSEEEEYYEDPLSFFFGYPRRQMQKRNKSQPRKQQVQKQPQDYRNPSPNDYRRYNDYQEEEDENQYNGYYRNQQPKRKQTPPQPQPQPQEEFDNPFDAWKEQHRRACAEFNRRRQEQEEEERRVAEKRRQLEEEERNYMEQKRREIAIMKRRAAEQAEAERLARQKEYSRAGPGFDFWDPYYAPVSQQRVMGKKQQRKQQQQQPQPQQRRYQQYPYYPGFGYPFFF